MTGAEMVVRRCGSGSRNDFRLSAALFCQFTCPVPQKHIKHVLVRHEQGAHAQKARRSSGKAACFCDSVRRHQCGDRLDRCPYGFDPGVCITGQCRPISSAPTPFRNAIPSHHKHCTKHNYLVRQSRLAAHLHEAFYVGPNGVRVRLLSIFRRCAIRESQPISGRATSSIRL